MSQNAHLPQSSRQTIRVVWHWFTMGPYHFARMEALGRQPGVELTIIESTSRDDHYWKRSGQDSSFRLFTLSTEPLGTRVHRKVRGGYTELLHTVKPDVVVESGYAEPNSRSVLFELRRRAPEVLQLIWSESTAADHTRRRLFERYKKRIVTCFDGALVAGTPHRRYMESLGLRPEAIRVVGGCVDNEFFRTRAAALRAGGNGSSTRPVSNPYFLFVGRFIPVKNLETLLQAFHLYRVMSPGLAHDLLLVGCGPGEPGLRALADKLKIDGLYFAGSKQLEDLPSYYAFATCLVVPSLSEPWGLVINEAMASGIPVLASNTCGAVEDLIVEGKTGWVCNPHNTMELASLLRKAAEATSQFRTMGAVAAERVERFSPGAYATQSIEHIRHLLANRARGFRPTPMLRGLTRLDCLVR